MGSMVDAEHELLIIDGEYRGFRRWWEAEVDNGDAIVDGQDDDGERGTIDVDGLDFV